MTSSGDELPAAPTPGHGAVIPVLHSCPEHGASFNLGQNICVLLALISMKHVAFLCLERVLHKKPSLIHVWIKVPQTMISFH